ncbi:MAG: undecaprenyl/decaprenyl-phosphate alpha-N-acetylglucosaminyl 1-phosphate transferase [Armatimonadetes bacterium]|nr:undecaprenyl/decaprenyl-phosphate alpha-N-acetylglucosaminyl 1-phosphate transferase [Armatimonadota bacterium]
MLTALALAFLVATSISIVMTPLSIQWAIKLGIIAQPSARKIHHEPIPSWGGVALAIAILIGSTVGWLSLKTLPANIFGVSLGLLVIIFIGTFDDRFSLRPKLKLAGQFIAALLPVVFGLKISFINNPLGEGYLYLTTWQSWLLTIFWILALTNAVNLIDGLDGLAAGVSFFAALTLSFLVANQNLLPIAVTFAAIAGACVGFLPYNFHPAKVFMGDTGAMTLGYLFATFSILGAVKSFAALSVLFMTSLVLAYPLIDTTFAILRRWLTGRSIFSADRGHLHHKLIDSGLDQRQAVLTLYALTLIFCLLALLLVKGT